LLRYYLATRLERAPEAQELHKELQAAGFICSYDWTVHGSVRGSNEEMAAVAVAEVAGVQTADVVIVLLPGGRGTHGELVAALALGKPVIIHSTDPGLFERDARTCVFYWHPLVTRTLRLSNIHALMWDIETKHLP
jgi:nucleoside 2-deoxyribosyltransferase